MAIPLTAEQEALIDPLLAFPPPQDVTPQVMFGLPPPMPTTNFFGRLGGRGVDPLLQQSRMQEFMMQQEAERQAALLGRELSGVDPMSPEYPLVKQQLVMQYPMALNSRTGQNLLRTTDYTFERGRQPSPDRSLIEQASLNGVTAEEIASLTGPDGRVNTVALGNLIGERKRALTPQRSQRNPLDSEIDSLTKQFKFLEDTGQFDSPVYKALQGQISQKMAERWGTPVAPTVAPAAAPGKVTIKSITPIE